MERDFKGVWISKEIWLDNKLTWMEKIVITEINSLDGKDGCFASNNYLADFFNLTPGRISQIISALIDKKYISAEYFREGKEITKRVLRILNTPIKNSKEGIKNIKEGYLENAKGINTLINNTNNNTDKEKEIYKSIIDGFYRYYNKEYDITGKERGSAKRIAKKLINYDNWQERLSEKVNALHQKSKKNPKFWSFTIPKLEYGWNELTDNKIQSNIQTEEIFNYLQEKKNGTQKVYN